MKSNNKYLFFFLGLVLFLSCDFSPTIKFNPVDLIQQDPLVLVIKHRQDSLSLEVSNQVSTALAYTKLPVETVDLGLISDSFHINPSIRSIVVSSFLISELSASEIELLTTFVANGNSLVFLGAVTYDEFSFLQGVVPFSDFNIDKTSKGAYFFEDVFPSTKGITYFDSLQVAHEGIDENQFIKKVKVLVGAGNNPKYPLVVSNKIGLGEVITINSNNLFEKEYRGLLFASILRGLEGIPYSVANVSTIFLDDFPAPLYNEKLAPIDEEYDTTHAEFISKIWWPDMKALADTFEISYSAMTAFNYNANIVPPFDFFEWTSGTILQKGEQIQGSIFLAKDIVKTRHELAFHGYNHFSLWLEDWDNVNFMASSVYAARKRWRIDRMGKLPITYVPPTNLIDSVGISAIMKGMPSIRYMSSLYLGEKDIGTGREFGYEPYSTGERIFDYPRISSGFNMRENSLFDQQSLQLLTGIWTHFIHPDDVFQVTQRGEDSFTSRNPLKLGWKSHPTYGYGLYHVFRERLIYTNDRYPLLRYVNAKEGGALTEDWRNSIVVYKKNNSERVLFPLKDPSYTNKSLLESKNYWYSYLTIENAIEFEDSLKSQGISFGKSSLAKGFLYQFGTTNDSLRVPDFSPVERYDTQFLNAQANSILQRSRLYQTEQTDEFGNIVYLTEEEDPDWIDNRLNDAIRAYRENPNDDDAIENLLALSIEFGDLQRAIVILERKMLSTPVWSERDLERLFRYYGWEGVINQAENFLERLWIRYASKEVIDVKKYAVATLGISGAAFDRKWAERELMLYPNDERINLNYLSSLENEENWPYIKKELRRLIRLNPESDSLYAYTLQRSFYYENADSTLSLVEEFPVSKHPQLDTYATNIAFLYAYEKFNFPKALYWADRANGFDEKLKLDWLAELNLYSEYTRISDELLLENPTDDSLRAKIGAQLYYEGFIKEGRETLYPLFVNNPNGKTSAHVLINAEMKFLSYDERKELYKSYPDFFSREERDRLQTEYRWTEGIEGSAYGEFSNDNFDNTFARFGISAQLGNRRKITHTFKGEDLFVQRKRLNINQTNNFIGPGYEFERKSLDQAWNYKLGGMLFAGSSKIITELNTSLSYSYNSTFTSLGISFEPVLTNIAIQNNYYKLKPELYREDIWLKDFLVTSFSASSSFYTNNVFEYELYGRVYLQPIKRKIRIRPIAELSYADASKSFISGEPFYTPNGFFSQGIGFDLRYRDPDSFDFWTKLEFELMGKHEKTDGYFATGRIQFDHKFKKFWEVRVGSDISTSKVFRSNRFFFSISYYFKNHLKTDKVYTR